LKNGYKELRRESKGWSLETLFYQKKLKKVIKTSSPTTAEENTLESILK
jgi:hypothetical protein